MPNINNLPEGSGIPEELKIPEEVKSPEELKIELEKLNEDRKTIVKEKIEFDPGTIHILNISLTTIEENIRRIKETLAGFTSRGGTDAIEQN